MEMKEQIRDVIVKMLKVKPEEIRDDAKLYDSIGVDSTEMVELLIALEKSFGVKISPKEVTKFSTLNEIEKIIQSKQSA